MTAQTVLLTGATGYLGRRLARRLLEQGTPRLVLAVRGSEARADLTTALSAYHDRLGFLQVDLTSPDPLGGVSDDDLANVTDVIHAAAVTRFNVERELAQRVNVDGTRSVVALARRCPRLRMFGYVSTLYSTGLRDGAVGEELCGDAGFANHYEWSKWAAEHVVAEADDLPSRILRVATVIADDLTGAVTQHNAFHETLKLCFYGLLSLLPGRATTPMYVVTGDFVTDAVVDLMAAESTAGVFHVSHDRSAALTLGEVLDIVFECFESCEDFRRKGILRPLLADAESFELLVEGVSPMAGSIVTQALVNVSPFARQLYVEKDVTTDRLRSVTASPPADPRQLVAATVQSLVETRWGRRAPA